MNIIDRIENKLRLLEEALKPEDIAARFHQTKTKKKNKPERIKTFKSHHLAAQKILFDPQNAELFSPAKFKRRITTAVDEIGRPVQISEPDYGVVDVKPLMMKVLVVPGGTSNTGAAQLTTISVKKFLENKKLLDHLNEAWTQLENDYITINKTYREKKEEVTSDFSSYMSEGERQKINADFAATATKKMRKIDARAVAALSSALPAYEFDIKHRAVLGEWFLNGTKPLADIWGKHIVLFMRNKKSGVYHLLARKGRDWYAQLTHPTNPSFKIIAPDVEPLWHDPLLPSKQKLEELLDKYTEEKHPDEHRLIQSLLEKQVWLRTFAQRSASTIKHLDTPHAFDWTVLDKKGSNKHQKEVGDIQEDVVKRFLAAYSISDVDEREKQLRAIYKYLNEGYNPQYPDYPDERIPKLNEIYNIAYNADGLAKRIIMTRKVLRLLDAELYTYVRNKIVEEGRIARGVAHDGGESEAGLSVTEIIKIVLGFDKFLMGVSAKDMNLLALWAGKLHFNFPEKYLNLAKQALIANADALKFDDKAAADTLAGRVTPVEYYFSLLNQASTGLSSGLSPRFPTLAANCDKGAQLARRVANEQTTARIKTIIKELQQGALSEQNSDYLGQFVNNVRDLVGQAHVVEKAITANIKRDQQIIKFRDAIKRKSADISASLDKLNGTAQDIPLLNGIVADCDNIARSMGKLAEIFNDTTVKIDGASNRTTESRSTLKNIVSQKYGALLEDAATYIALHKIWKRICSLAQVDDVPDIKDRKISQQYVPPMTSLGKTLLYMATSQWGSIRNPKTIRAEYAVGEKIEIIASDVLTTHRSVRPDLISVVEREQYENIMRRSGEDVSWFSSAVAETEQMRKAKIAELQARLQTIDDEEIAEELEALKAIQENMEFDVDTGTYIPRNVSLFAPRTELSQALHAIKSSKDPNTNLLDITYSIWQQLQKDLAAEQVEQKQHELVRAANNELKQSIEQWFDVDTDIISLIVYDEYTEDESIPKTTKGHPILFVYNNKYFYELNTKFVEFTPDDAVEEQPEKTEDSIEDYFQKLETELEDAEVSEGLTDVVAALQDLYGYRFAIVGPDKQSIIVTIIDYDKTSDEFTLEDDDGNPYVISPKDLLTRLGAYWASVKQEVAVNAEGKMFNGYVKSFGENIVTIDITGYDKDIDAPYGAMIDYIANSVPIGLVTTEEAEPKEETERETSEEAEEIAPEETGTETPEEIKLGEGEYDIDIDMLKQLEGYEFRASMNGSATKCVLGGFDDDKQIFYIICDGETKLIDPQGLVKLLAIYWASVKHPIELILNGEEVSGEISLVEKSGMIIVDIDGSEEQLKIDPAYVVEYMVTGEPLELETEETEKSEENKEEFEEEEELEEGGEKESEEPIEDEEESTKIE